ncbi:helix-turn-helix transcriptional regulator [Devosia sp.]|uniref:helix-turn-helix domain-containing protein n=1 Tax=Devosia sp. TaxID=1871048 RepID=UPI001AD30233|nr:helix-turn-helix transcriptional regulator [Devosia sp.]MBN9332775.1 helix-turn-helix transcriptional regulator [Devosia sp.]
MDSRELVAWNMRRLRVDRKLSQDRLAELSGVDRTYVSRLERMLENPSIGILDKVATAMSVSIAELFAPPAADAAKPKPLKAGRRPSSVI